jgi:hypothetical protein
MKFMNHPKRRTRIQANARFVAIARRMKQGVKTIRDPIIIGASPNLSDATPPDGFEKIPATFTNVKARPAQNRLSP